MVEPFQLHKKLAINMAVQPIINKRVVLAFEYILVVGDFAHVLWRHPISQYKEEHVRKTHEHFRAAESARPSRNIQPKTIMKRKLTLRKVLFSIEECPLQWVCQI
jgi:hypothetical protein